MAGGRAIQVLVATQNEEVYDILAKRDDVRFEIALFTSTIDQLLPHYQLLIIDEDDIVESNSTKSDTNERAAQLKVRRCTSEEFTGNPSKWLETALFDAGAMRELPPHYCIAFVSYSGGTGRTTLALDTALYYTAACKTYRDKHRRELEAMGDVSDRSAMFVEFCYGRSSLAALTGLEMPHMYGLATQPEIKPHSYRGVSLVPMDYDNVRMMPKDLLAGYLEREINQHALTVIDCLWRHGFADAFAKRVDLWLVVASGRPDAVDNARKLYEELDDDPQFKGKVWLLLNQSPANAQGQVPGGLDWKIVLKHIGRADEYKGTLGRDVIAKIFDPAWQMIEKPPKPGR
jgi:hypothetical protein